MQIQLDSISSVDAQIHLTPLCCERKNHDSTEMLPILMKVSWHGNKTTAGCLALRGIAV